MNKSVPVGSPLHNDTSDIQNIHSTDGEGGDSTCNSVVDDIPVPDRTLPSTRMSSFRTNRHHSRDFSRSSDNYNDTTEKGIVDRELKVNMSHDSELDVVKFIHLAPQKSPSVRFTIDNDSLSTPTDTNAVSLSSPMIPPDNDNVVNDNDIRSGLLPGDAYLPRLLSQSWTYGSNTTPNMPSFRDLRSFSEGHGDTKEEEENFHVTGIQIRGFYNPLSGRYSDMVLDQQVTENDNRKNSAQKRRTIVSQRVEPIKTKRPSFAQNRRNPNYLDSSFYSRLCNPFQTMSDKEIKFHTIQLLADQRAENHNDKKGKCC